MDINELARNLFQVILVGGFAFLVLTALGILLLAPLIAIVITFWDIFGRDDIAVGKLVWPIVVLLVPIIGMASYWMSHPTSAELWTSQRQENLMRRAA